MTGQGKKGVRAGGRGIWREFANAPGVSRITLFAYPNIFDASTRPTRAEGDHGNSPTTQSKVARSSTSCGNAVTGPTVRISRFGCAMRGSATLQ